MGLNHKKLFRRFLIYKLESSLSDIMTKYLIIFGAGASFGSDNNNVPPLGSDLFFALQRFNPDGWGKIDGNLANSFQFDFETTMPLLNPHTMPPLQRAMAAYFFRFQPTQNSLYYKLANLIFQKAWDGALATFNYERLLEISLIAAGIQPFIRNAPNHKKPIELCIPHGACHIFCQAVRGSAQGISFSGPNITTNGPVEVIADPQVFQNRIVNDAFPPVMSYFEPAKRTTSGANFIEAQRIRFADLVDKAKKIAIIGLRVREHDKHIWEPLSKTNAKLIYCSGKSAGDEFSRWLEKNRNGKNDVILNSYFQDEFDNIINELEL